jgi:ketosteroid isomerase-like protein
MAMKPKLELRVKQVVEAGDIALVICEWEFTGTDPAGKPITLRAEGREVHRRQPDGTWRILIDNPRYF